MTGRDTRRCYVADVTLMCEVRWDPGAVPQR